MASNFCVICCNGKENLENKIKTFRLPRKSGSEKTPNPKDTAVCER